MSKLMLEEMIQVMNERLKEFNKELQQQPLLSG